MKKILKIPHPTIPDVIVASDGQIYLPKSGNNKAHWTYGSLMSNGYRCVRIYKKSYFVHRLVAETFIPNPENKPFIDHRNHIRDDNNVENLKWVTAKENQNNTVRNKPVGKRRCDFDNQQEYEAARARDRYINEPGYKEYHRDYLRNWRAERKSTLHKD